MFKPLEAHRESSTSTVHPVTHYVSYKNFLESHKTYLTAINSNYVPKSFHEAIQNENRKEAMTKEIWPLEENGTWTREQLSEGNSVIDSKRNYKIKYKPNEEIEMHKARLVAKGFTQMKGVVFHETCAHITKRVDIHETFSPVAKCDTVRTILVVAKNG